jgi:hypothetical protein
MRLDEVIVVCRPVWGKPDDDPRQTGRAQVFRRAGQQSQPHTLPAFIPSTAQRYVRVEVRSLGIRELFS